jgi:hypothetical protein
MSEPAPVRVLDADASTELELGPAAPITLFGTTDPRLALERMSELARALVDVVREQKLSVKIQGREHLRVEAWTTLGGMLGIVPVVVWTKPNEIGDGFVARVEVHRVLDDRIVGAAEAECSRVEKVWQDRYPYSLRSMAQTRAISRALRAPLGQVVVLAGYDATALEEMPPAEPERPAEPAKPPTAPVQPTPAQTAEVKTLLHTLEMADPAIDWPGRAREIAKVEWKLLTRSQVAHVIDELRAELAALMPVDDEAST